MTSTKGRMATRIIEMFEYFDNHRRPATANELSRALGWPQSSTSDLLQVLIAAGLVFRDERRAYSPSPRAALLGSCSQPACVRDGRLAASAERLAKRTGVGVAILGRVGLDAQVFRWIEPATPFADVDPRRFAAGCRTPLIENAAGWLLISGQSIDRRAGIIHRLRAENSATHLMDRPVLEEQIAIARKQGYVDGPAGFNTNARLCGALVPDLDPGRAIVLALVFEQGRAADSKLFGPLVLAAAQHCATGGAPTRKLAASDARTVYA